MPEPDPRRRILELIAAHAPAYRGGAERAGHMRGGLRGRLRSPKPDRRRALQLFAASADGYSEGLLRAHGITNEMMVELVRAGLATATAERVVAGSRKLEVARVRITEARRAALCRASTSWLNEGGTLR